MKVVIAERKREKPAGTPVFGTVFSDHMYMCEYRNGGWREDWILPYAPLSLNPSAAVFHYGQAVFEGLKAYRRGDKITLFRPRDNFARLNASCDRLCIPRIDETAALNGLCELLKIDRDWIPEGDGTSLYIRPFIFAEDNSLGVHASHNYTFIIITSPVGAYYANGFAPVKLYAEEKYVRSVKGGTGHQKFAGNYAMSLKASEEAAALGFDQVMWLDAVSHEYVEEVGSMNIFFVMGKEVVTPELTGSILPGITRRSVIEYLRAKGIKVTERKISIKELTAGNATECFGTGTAAVISPVSGFRYQGKDYTFGNGSTGELASTLYDNLTAIQTGTAPDPFGWVYEVK